MEHIASILFLITTVSWIGALLGLGLMLDAIGMHLTLLGIEVQGDGGYLFVLAVVVCSVFVLCMDKEKAANFIDNLKG